MNHAATSASLRELRDKCSPPTVMKASTLVVALAWFAAVSCSRELPKGDNDGSGAGSVDTPDVEVTVSSTPAASHSNQAATLSGSDYPIRAGAPDEQMEWFVNSLISENREVQAAIARAGSAAMISGLTLEDRRQIGSLIVGMEDFTPSPFGGELIQFEKYTVIIVPGKARSLDRSVFLIRVGTEGWMVLGKLEA